MRLKKGEYTIRLDSRRKSLTVCNGCMLRKIWFQPAKVSRRLGEVDYSIGFNI